MLLDLEVIDEYFIIMFINLVSNNICYERMGLILLDFDKIIF